MDVDEIMMNLMQRAQNGALIQRRNLQGSDDINRAAYDIRVEIRMMCEHLGLPMPEELPPYKRLTQRQYLPELRMSYSYPAAWTDTSEWIPVAAESS
jgi:hypothetical protein